MKPEPRPKVEGKTPWKRLDNAVGHIFTISKDDVLKAEARAKHTRAKDRTQKHSKKAVR
jgi:hypothetical protein